MRAVMLDFPDTALFILMPRMFALGYLTYKRKYKLQSRIEFCNIFRTSHGTICPVKLIEHDEGTKRYEISLD